MTTAAKSLRHTLLAHQNLKLATVILAGCLTAMTGSMISPVLSEIVEDLNLDPRWAGLLVSLPFFTFALFSPVLGILADRVGRLRVLTACLVVFALMGMVGAVLPNLPLLLLSRAVLGAASGGMAAASMGILSSLYTGEARSRALGYGISSLTLANILFPLLGAWVGALHWQYAFGLYGIGLPVALLAMLTLSDRAPFSKPAKETTNHSESRPISPNQKLGTLLKQSPVPQLLFVLWGTSALMFAMVVYLPLYLRTTLGTGIVFNGIALAGLGIGAAIASLLATRLIKRWGVRRLVGAGLLFMALLLSLIPSLHQVPLVLLVGFGFGFSVGAVLPSLYGCLSLLAPSELQASVLAIAAGIGFLGNFSSPLLLGLVWKGLGLPAVFYTAAVGAGAIALFSRRVAFGK